METWFWILGWILTIFTIAGNGFVIFLVSTKRQLQTKTNAFIVSLAVADFCVGATVVPFNFFCNMNSDCHWPRRWPSCIDLIRWLFGYASVINLCGLVLDRYIVIVKPLKYLTLVTDRRVIQMVFFSWTVPVGFVITSLMLVLYDNSVSVFVTVFTLFVEFVSCCMLIFCFLSMIIVVYKHDRSSAALAKQLRFNHQGLTSYTHDKSAVVMLTIVIGLFLICYGIYLRCGLVAHFSHSKCNDDNYKIPLLVLNSGINPLSYAFFKRDIKKKIKRMSLCRLILKRN